MKKLQKEQKIFLVLMLLLLVVQIVVLIFFAGKKSGFHEDELYTYFSTNRTAGLFAEDRTWVDTEKFKNEFVVLEGEQFRYSLVKTVQSWDVHPPLYYYIVHTVCSLTPGVFSKWQGILVNLIAYVLSFVLLAKVVFTTVTMPGNAFADREEKEPSEAKSSSDGELKHISARARWLTLLVCGFWGFSCAVISGVMFIRMYQWLTVFVLLCLWLHLRAVSKQDFGIKRFLLPLAFTVFLGFMTQYYYIIFHIFLGAGFCILLLKHRKIKEMLAYAAACAVGLGSAVFYYPSSLAHIFRGYRGTEAVSEFGDVSNTWGRLQFFAGLFDDYVMSGTLSIWVLAICLLGVTAWYLQKRKKWEGRFFTEAVCLLIFTVAGYFFTISKTALLLGETSNRYQLPVYGVIIFLLIYAVWFLAEGLLQNRGIGSKKLPVIAAGLAIVLLLVDMGALFGGKVIFLYEEEADMAQFVCEKEDVPVLVSYNESGVDHIWWLADWLMVYDNVYLASQQNEEPIVDTKITESDSVLVYISAWEEEEAFLQELMRNNPKLSDCRVVAKKSLWTLYELS